MSKFAKLRTDPVGYLIDSRWPPLRAAGRRLLHRQRSRAVRAAKGNQTASLEVIMTVYNTASYVEEAVRSALDQSRPPDRLTIVDDASSDDSPSILRNLAQRHPAVQVFRSPVNRGTYWCKNWALSQSAADYVAFHDSDDVSHPDRLAVQLGYLSTAPAVAGCTVQWDRVDDDGRALVVDGRAERMAPITLMIRRAEVLARAGYFDSVRIAADSEYLARLSRVFGPGGVRHLRHRLYTGLVRAGSLTTEPRSGIIWTPDDRCAASAFRREVVGDRAAYHRAFSSWQAASQDLRIGFPMTKRPFPVPDSLTISNADAGAPARIDL